MGKIGYLVLENGQVWQGESFGTDVDVTGEVVFNTGMVGYPEGFTDPSYCGQILICTYPLIGNYGFPPRINTDKFPSFLESEKAQIQGLIVSEYVDHKTHWQGLKTLRQWLREEKVPALCGIDTRSLTKTIREVGVMKGLMTFDKPPKKGFLFRDINSENLVSYVSCKKPIIYGSGKLRLLIIDCGMKMNQLRLFLKQDVTMVRVPWNFDPTVERGYEDIDAVFISNGPGDPKMAAITIKVVKKLMDRKIPTLGICLGNQIMALASSGNTYKLKYGHRSQNQPVKDLKSGKCYITTQNHGFAVDTKTLEGGWEPWFINLNDKTNEGIIHTKFPFFSTQFHPEAAPGPTDTEWIFDYFIEETKKWLKKN